MALSKTLYIFIQNNNNYVFILNSSSFMQIYLKKYIYIKNNNNFTFLFQLYEINDDPKRKEFLDDLFSYMQKRGKLNIFSVYNF